MHSQLRSAPNRRETSQGPIDLSQYRIPRQIPKMTTRSTSTTTTMSTTPRTVPIITSLGTAPTHTIYSSAVPSSCSTSSSTSMSSSSSSSSTATTTRHQERHPKSKFQIAENIISSRGTIDSLFSISGQNYSTVDQIVRYLSSSPPPPASSPKLAYSYSNIEENLQCPLCIDRLRDPRALPCQHVFCCTCLKSIPSSNLPYPTIACPLCRRSFPYNGADQFPVSYIHRQLLELVPKNYDINGKCTKCQEKTSLILCSCCDFLLCDKCYRNDREKVLDNIQHIVQTCSYRLNRIHATRDQLNDLNDQNRKKTQQVELLFDNFERKLFAHKQTVLNSLKRFNEQLEEDFWSKLNIPIGNTTEPYVQLLQQAESLLKKSQTTSFDDILSLFYNLNSIDEQLEQANSLIDTCDIQNLFKQNIQFSNHESDEQVRIHLNQMSTPQKVFPLIPSSILPRSTKRLRKTEPKRHVEQVDDDDDDIVTAENNNNNNNGDHDDDGGNHLTVLKRMKVECEHETHSISPSSSMEPLLLLNHLNMELQQENDASDNDIIYLETVQAKSPTTINFEELMQIIAAPE